jgi:hypothetical protein
MSSFVPPLSVSRMLLGEADGDPGHVHQRVVLEPELVVRESTIGSS